MKLVIDRDKWVRGGEPGTSLLCGPGKPKLAGKMCCLGFYALACGMKPADILEMGRPEDLKNAPIPKEYEWLVVVDLDDQDNEVFADSSAANRLIDINDSENYIGNERDREAELVAEFAEHGVEVEFIGGKA